MCKFPDDKEETFSIFFVSVPLNELFLSWKF